MQVSKTLVFLQMALVGFRTWNVEQTKLFRPGDLYEPLAFSLYNGCPYNDPVICWSSHEENCTEFEEQSWETENNDHIEGLLALSRDPGRVTGAQDTVRPEPLSQADYESEVDSAAVEDQGESGLGNNPCEVNELDQKEEKEAEEENVAKSSSSSSDGKENESEDETQEVDQTESKNSEESEKEEEEVVSSRRFIALEASEQDSSEQDSSVDGDKEPSCNSSTLVQRTNRICGPSESNRQSLERRRRSDEIEQRDLERDFLASDSEPIETHNLPSGCTEVQDLEHDRGVSSSARGGSASRRERQKLARAHVVSAKSRRENRRDSDEGESQVHQESESEEEGNEEDPNQVADQEEGLDTYRDINAYIRSRPVDHHPECLCDDCDPGGRKKDKHWAPLPPKISTQFDVAVDKRETRKKRKSSEKLTPAQRAVVRRVPRSRRNVTPNRSVSTQVPPALTPVRRSSTTPTQRSPDQLSIDQCRPFYVSPGSTTRDAIERREPISRSTGVNMPRDRATPKRLRFTWNSNKRGDSRSEESSGDSREAGGDAIHLDGKRHAAGAGAGGGGHMTEEEMLQMAIAQSLEQSGPTASMQEGVGDDCKKPSASDDCDASERFDCIGSSSEEPNTPDEDDPIAIDARQRAAQPQQLSSPYAAAADSVDVRDDERGTLGSGIARQLAPDRGAQGPLTTRRQGLRVYRGPRGSSPPRVEPNTPDEDDPIVMDARQRAAQPQQLSSPYAAAADSVDDDERGTLGSGIARQLAPDRGTQGPLTTRRQGLRVYRGPRGSSPPRVSSSLASSQASNAPASVARRQIDDSESDSSDGEWSVPVERAQNEASDELVDTDTDESSEQSDQSVDMSVNNDDIDQAPHIYFRYECPISRSIRHRGGGGLPHILHGDLVVFFDEMISLDEYFGDASEVDTYGIFGSLVDDLSRWNGQPCDEEEGYPILVYNCDAIPMEDLSFMVVKVYRRNENGEWFSILRANDSPWQGWLPLGLFNVVSGGYTVNQELKESSLKFLGTEFKPKYRVFVKKMRKRNRMYRVRLRLDPYRLPTSQDLGMSWFNEVSLFPFFGAFIGNNDQEFGHWNGRRDLTTMYLFLQHISGMLKK